MARELHDIVAYSFATINVQAGVAAHVADDRPEQAAEALRAIQEISGEASRELRALLGVMRTADRTEAPLHGLARLDTLAETTTAAGLSTRVVVSGRARSMPSPASPSRPTGPSCVPAVTSGCTHRASRARDGSWR